MFYTIYKTTNLTNGKFYIGKHQTDNLDDGYLGSGKHLKCAIGKYGHDKFSKEILYVFDNEIEMNQKEFELVTQEFCLREDTYNICVGGHGGFGYINSQPELVAKRDAYKNKLAGRNAANKVLVEKYGSLTNFNRVGSPLGLKKIEELRNNDPEFDHKMRQSAKRGLEKALSTESKEKRKNTMRERGHSKGASNSQYGTFWITDGSKNKKIKKSDQIPEGWYKGRKY
jgi:hypothetical protein